MKRLKKDLKCWNKESFKDIQNQGKELLAKINFLDAKDEVVAMIEWGVIGYKKDLTEWILEDKEETKVFASSKSKD